jgi:hypothetical protein
VDVTSAPTLTLATLPVPVAPTNTPALPSLRPAITGHGLPDGLDLGDVEGSISDALNVLFPYQGLTKTVASTMSSTLAVRSPDDDLFVSFGSLIDALDYSMTIAESTTTLPTATASDIMPTVSIAVRVLEQNDGLIGDFDAVSNAWTMIGAALLPTAGWV